MHSELLPNQRHLFDMPSSVSYLNCAYMSPLSRAVVEAGERAVHSKARPWEITAQDFFEQPNRARRLLADLMGVDDPGAFAVVPSASYGLAVAAANQPMAEGDGFR